MEVSKGKLAKGDKNKLAEVILCLRVLRKKRCYHGRRMLKDWRDKLRSWTRATSEKLTKYAPVGGKCCWLGDTVVLRRQISF